MRASKTTPAPAAAPLPPGAARPSPAIAAERIRRSVVHEVIRCIADPWKPGIVLLLWLGEGSFTGLVRALGISRSTLAQRLGQLVDDGCVLRSEGAVAPPEPGPYRLTPKGEDLLGIVLLNRQWNARWGVGNRLLPELAFRHSCGAPLSLHFLCGRCEQPARAREVKVLQTVVPGHHSADGDAAPDYRRMRNHRSGPDGQSLAGENLAGDRWTSLVLALAFQGLRRNSEFEQAIGIAPNILANRLATLTAHGIFDRVPYPSSPLRYEYRLTPKGLDRYPVVLAMMMWGRKWLDPRPPLGWNMLHKPCHEWLEPRLACEACGGDVHPGSTGVQGPAAIRVATAPS